MAESALGVLGLALAILAWVAPEWWSTVPTWARILGTSVGVFLGGLAVGIYFAGTRKRAQDIEPSAVKTSLRLRFNGSHQIPTRVHEDNVFRWFTLFSASRYMQAMNERADPVFVASIPRTWTILMIMERPALFSEVKIFHSGVLPPYEVKDTSVRHVLVFFSADIPAGELEIHLVPVAPS